MTKYVKNAVPVLGEFLKTIMLFFSAVNTSWVSQKHMLTKKVFLN